MHEPDEMIPRSMFKENIATGSSRQHNGNHYGDNYFNYQIWSSTAIGMAVPDYTRAQRSRQGVKDAIEKEEACINKLQGSLQKARPDAELVRARTRVQRRALRLLRRYEAWKEEQDRRAPRAVIVKSPNTFKAAPIFFEDLSGAQIPLPYEYFCRWSTLHAHLMCIFESRPGVNFIRRESFMFARLDSRRGELEEFAPSAWEDHVMPGMRVSAMMDFCGSLGATGCSCPCGSLRMEVNEVSEKVSCSDCGRPYDVVPSVPRICRIRTMRRFHPDTTASIVRNELQSCFKGVLINFNPRWPGREKISETIETAAPSICKGTRKRNVYSCVDGQVPPSWSDLCSAHFCRISKDALPRGVSLLVSDQSPKPGGLVTKQSPTHAKEETKKRYRGHVKRPRLQSQGFRIQQPSGRGLG
ncbi:hypothetical protein AC579_10307 [Pseudocercospora musae]|uniref:Ubiquitin-like domain-containing protein n=1 Tax=Pseudocercospora musae TaxID=113226 RepID=A0A139I2K2_9PEZI|nr:hypothetical protein AC579_10307 [Pseudocercospora musae]